MKTRYFKYYWYKDSKKKFDYYRITQHNVIEKKRYHNDKWENWREIANGDFSKLLEDRLEEISEEDYFLSFL